MKSTLTHFLIVLVLMLSAIAAYGTFYAALSAKSSMVADLQSSIDQGTQTANHIASARAAISEIAGDEAVVRGYFISDMAAGPFFDDLQARGRAQGATVSVLSASTDTVNKYPVLTLSLTVKGAFDAVMRTIGVIEYAPYDLSVSALSVQQDDPKSWHADLKVVVGAASSTPGTTASVAEPHVPASATTTVVQAPSKPYPIE